MVVDKFDVEIECHGKNIADKKYAPQKEECEVTLINIRSFGRGLPDKIKFWECKTYIFLSSAII